MTYPMMNKILVVDDNPDFLELVKTYLKEDFTVETASNAIDALAKVHATVYSALILDVSLPDFTGYYLGKLIREESANIPMAFLTNYDGEITRENAEELDAEFWRKSDIINDPKLLAFSIHKLYE